MGIITEKDMLKKSAEKDIWLIEDAARGTGRFVGRITPTGSRLFYYRYSNARGDRDRLSIGPFDPKGDGASAYNVRQAREKARELSALYQSGIKNLREYLEQKQAEELQKELDEQLRMNQEREALANAAMRTLCVRSLFERWCSTELQPSLRADGKRNGRKDGGAYVRAQFERHVFPTIGERPVRDIRKNDLLEIIDIQKSKGQLRTASILLSDLRQMMSFALDRELIDVNPLANLKKARIVGVAVERDRALSVEEISLLAQALPQAQLNARTEAAIWLLLATGARIGELMGCIWADCLSSNTKDAKKRISELKDIGSKDDVKVGIVDLDNKSWHLPDTKNQRPHTIHLSDFAVQQFTLLQDLRPMLSTLEETSPWVFPARNPARPVCVKNFGKQISDRQRRERPRLAGRSQNTDSLSLPGGKWTAHDLRRTASTLMAKLGFSGDVIDEALNHIIESRVRRTYIRDRREKEQAEAFDALGKKLAEIQKSSNKVVQA